MVTVQLYEERPIGISLPDQVTLTITEADPVVKGQTAASSYKPAMLENGIRVLVPPFIGVGRTHHRRHQRNHLRAPRRLMRLRPVRRHAQESDKTTMARSALLNVMVQAAMKAGRSLSRDFGEVQNLQVSLKGPGDYRQPGRPQGRGDHLRRAVEGAAGLRLPDGGARRGRRRRRPAPLDRRSARRHHQLPARHSACSPSRSRWSARARSSPASSTIRRWTSSTPPSAAAAPSSTTAACASPAARKLSDAVIGCGVPHLGRGHHGNFLVELRNVMGEVAGIRRLGAAALDLAYVAAGRMDGFWEDRPVALGHRRRHPADPRGRRLRLRHAMAARTCSTTARSSPATRRSTARC